MELCQPAIWFRLEEARLAVPLDAVREILPMAALTRPPGLPPSVAGLLNLGGELFPVLRLADLMGLPEVEFLVDDHLIFCSVGGREVVLPASGVEGLETKPESLQQLPVAEDQTFNGCVQATLRIDGEDYHLLNPERILLEEESRRMEEFRNVEQRRLDESGGDS